jgi:uncharacterized protein (TIGR02145 family)
MGSKNELLFFSLMICIIVAFIIGCKKKDSTIIDNIVIELPTINTTEIRDIADIQAVGRGILSSDGGSGLFACGVCWSSDSTNWKFEKSAFGLYNSIIKIEGDFNFTGSITNLLPNSRYFARAYATNMIGTSYGKTISFTTTAPFVAQINFNPTVNYDFIHDQDGKTYRTVAIGNHVWMAENLKAITYNDGISLDRDYDYCWYNNDLNSNDATFGLLYSWGAVSSGKVCPVGWHVPSMEEWGILSDFLGGWEVAGGKLKETGMVHWTSSDSVATNASGFTALPSGVYALNGYSGKSLFNSVDSSGYYWSASSHTERQTGVLITRWGFVGLDFKTESISFMVWPFTPYMAIRCVKD